MDAHHRSGGGRFVRDGFLTRENLLLQRLRASHQALACGRADITRLDGRRVPEAIVCARMRRFSSLASWR
jgi:hypothetical protein